MKTIKQFFLSRQSGSRQQTEGERKVRFRLSMIAFNFISIPLVPLPLYFFTELNYIDSFCYTIAFGFASEALLITVPNCLIILQQIRNYGLYNWSIIQIRGLRFNFTPNCGLMQEQGIIAFARLYVLHLFFLLILPIATHFFGEFLAQSVLALIIALNLYMVLFFLFLQLKFPTVLLCGTSDPATIDLELIMQEECSPFGVSSMLYRKAFVDMNPLLAFEFQDRRLSDVFNIDWRIPFVSTALSANVLVIDARFISDFLLEEVNFFLVRFSEAIRQQKEQQKEKKSIVFCIQDDLSSPFFDNVYFWELIDRNSEYFFIDFVKRSEIIEFLRKKLPIRFNVFFRYRSLSFWQWLKRRHQADFSGRNQLALLQQFKPVRLFPYQTLKDEYGCQSEGARTEIALLILFSIELFGLPKNHDLRIKIATHDPRLEVPTLLKERCEDEMWIRICCEYFRNLTVDFDKSVFSTQIIEGENWWPVVIPVSAILAVYDAATDFVIWNEDDLPGAIDVDDFSDNKEKRKLVSRIVKSMERKEYRSGVWFEIGIRLDMPSLFVAADVRNQFGDEGVTTVRRGFPSDWEYCGDYFAFTTFVKGEPRRVRVPFGSVTYVEDKYAGFRLRLEDAVPTAAKGQPSNVAARNESAFRDVSLRSGQRAIASWEEALGPEHPEFAVNVRRIAFSYQQQGWHAESVELYRRVLAMRERTLGPEHPDIAESLDDVAWRYEEGRRYNQAEPLYQRALAMRERIFGREHASVVTSINNLAWLCQKQNRDKEALRLYKRAADILDGTVGVAHSYALWILVNEVFLCLVEDCYGAATRRYQRALTAFEETPHSRNSGTISDDGKFEELVKYQSRFREAEPLYRCAREKSEETLGIKDPRTLLCIDNFAFFYLIQGRYEDAEPLFQRAWEIRETKLGPSHHDVAHSLHNIAALFSCQQRYDEAKPLLQRALAIRESTLGPEHPDVARSLHNLGRLCLYKGCYGEGISLCHRALKIRENVLGPDHPDVAQTLENLAWLYRFQAAFDEAEALCHRALVIREAAFGPGHSDVAQSLNNLAGIYDIQGRFEEAAPLCQRALAIYEVAATGLDHPGVGNSVRVLAFLHYSQGEYEEAEPLFRRALTINETSLGPDHFEVATSLESLAVLYYAQGRYEEAEPLYQRALAIREAILGPDHSEVARNLNDLARLYHAQGRYEEAEPLYQRALAINEGTLGSDHPQTGAIRKQLTKIRWRKRFKPKIF